MKTREETRRQCSTLNHFDFRNVEKQRNENRFLHRPNFVYVAKINENLKKMECRALSLRLFVFTRWGLAQFECDFEPQ